MTRVIFRLKSSGIEGNYSVLQRACAVLPLRDIFESVCLLLLIGIAAG